MTKRLIVHVGAHKTGSTYLQSVLRNNLELLGTHGIHYEPSFFVPLADLRKRTPLDREGVQHFRSLVSEVAALGEKAVVLSAEALSGRYDRGYSNVENIASDLRQVTEGIDTHVILFTRRQDTFLESLYHQEIKRGRSMSFRSYLRKCDSHVFKWTRLADAYCSAFGGDELSVFPYEMIFESPRTVVEALLSPLVGFCEVPAIVLDETVANPGYSTLALQISRAVNPFLTTRGRQVLRRWLTKLSPKKPSRGFNLFDPADRQALLRYYAEDNRRLFAEYAKRDYLSYYLGHEALL